MAKPLKLPTILANRTSTDTVQSGAQLKLFFVKIGFKLTTMTMSSYSYSFTFILHIFFTYFIATYALTYCYNLVLQQ